MRPLLRIACALWVLTVMPLLFGCPTKSKDTAEVTPIAEPLAPTTSPSIEEPPTTDSEALKNVPNTPTSEVEAVRRISHGAEVELAEYVVKGKHTIFDFYSDGCPPCRELAPKLEALAERREDICLVVVDINRPGKRGIDWDSPVARQYQLESIPHLRIYGPEGEEIARGDEARSRVERWLAEE
ncbi:MAG: TlpA family protein disulfide reductase [Candidatus Zipacnadales bacterium]